MTLSNSTIICTACNTPPSLEHSYDGHVARCSCDFHYLDLDRNDRPPVWSTWEKAADPGNFAVKLEEYVGVEEDHVLCASCNSKDNIEIKLERVDLFGEKLKAQFICNNEHGIGDRQMRGVGYYRLGSRKAEAVNAVAQNPRVKE